MDEGIKVVQWLTIRQAASLMRLGFSRAYERLMRLHKRNPEYALLRRVTDKNKHKIWEVNPEVLGKIISGEQESHFDQLCHRVGSLESQIKILKLRLNDVEDLLESSLENGK